MVSYDLWWSMTCPWHVCPGFGSLFCWQVFPWAFRQIMSTGKSIYHLISVAYLMCVKWPYQCLYHIYIISYQCPYLYVHIYDMLGLYLPYHIISTHPDFSKFLLELEGVADAKLATDSEGLKCPVWCKTTATRRPLAADPWPPVGGTHIDDIDSVNLTNHKIILE